MINKIRDKFHLAPIALVILLVPLILRVSVVIPTASELMVYPISSGQSIDIFLHARTTVFIVLTCIATLFVLGIGLTENRWPKKSRLLIPLGVFLSSIVLATVFSQFRDVAMAGQIDRYEGFGVMVSYVGIAYMTYALIKSEKEASFLLHLILLCSIIVNSLAILQMVGVDIFNSEFGKALIIPSSVGGNKVNAFQLLDTFVCSTLNNPNFLSHYNGMILSIAVVRLLDNYKDWFTITVLVLATLALYAAGSSGGLIGLFMAVNIICFVKREPTKRDAAVVFACGGVLVLGFLIVSSVYRIYDFNEVLALTLLFLLFVPAHYLIKNWLSGKIQIYYGLASIIPIVIVAIGAYYMFVYEAGNSKVRSVVANSKNVAIEFMNGDSYEIDTGGENEINVEHGGETVCIVGKNESKEFTMSSFGSVTISFKEDGNLEYIEMKPIDLYFIVEDGQPYAINSLNSATSIEYPPQLGFKGNERFGSGRGMIWSRSLPLLKDSWLIGSGPDTFFLRYPQNDLVGKLNYGSPRIIVDKPHNWFLQIAVNIGIPALISVIAVYVMLFRLFMNRSNLISLSIFSGVSAYYFGGLINDSIPSVAPTFWVLLGMAIYVALSDKSKVQVN